MSTPVAMTMKGTNTAATPVSYRGQTPAITQRAHGGTHQIQRIQPAVVPIGVGIPSRCMGEDRIGLALWSFRSPVVGAENAA